MKRISQREQAQMVEADYRTGQGGRSPEKHNHNRLLLQRENPFHRDSSLVDSPLYTHALQQHRSARRITTRGGFHKWWLSCRLTMASQANRAERSNMNGKVEECVKVR